MKSIRKTALSGLVSALCIVILTIGSFIQTLDLSVAALAGLGVVFGMLELGTKRAVAIYAVISVLGLLLLPYKSPALVFAVFTGCYPLVKGFLQRFRSRTVCWILKILIFNLLLTAMIAAGKWLFRINDPLYGFQAVIYALGNFAFVLYDIALDRMIVLYFYRIKPLFDAHFKK